MLFILLFWFVLSPIPLKESDHRGDQFIIWNVGQGQWATYDTLETCYHFDVGGEHFPLKKIRQLCRHKHNEIYISHWDMDHMSGLKFLNHWPQVCRRQDPLGRASAKKDQLLFHFKTCSEPANPDIQKVFPFPDDQAKLPDISNARSFVFIVKKWLIPGDSRQEEEKIWSLRLPTDISGLVIGHHGSKTSSSLDLLRRLSQMRWAIASARWRKYKHPHPSVLQSFASQKKRVLRTEDWGNFYFDVSR